MAALLGAGLALLTIYVIESGIVIGLVTFTFLLSTPIVVLQVKIWGGTGFSMFAGASRSPHTLQNPKLRLA